MEIREIKTSLYTSMEVQGMGTAVVNAISNDPLHQHAVISALLTPLQQSLDHLAGARGNTNHNTQTDRVEQADTERDFSFRAFWTMIEAGLLRRNDAYREAARTVMTHMEPFDRSLYRYGYDGQTTEMNAFIQAMEQGPVPAALNAMQMGDWLDELKDKQQAFIQAYQGRIDEETEKQALLPTREARSQVLDYLKALTQTMNGLAITQLQGLADLNARVDRIIQEFETKARSRRARRQREGEGLDEEMM